MMWGLRLKAGFTEALQQASVTLFRTSSVSIKLVCGLIVIIYVATWFGESSESALSSALGLLPAYVWPPHFRIWTLVTHCFLEVHLWEVVADIVTLVLVSKLLEPLWGALEMVVFFFVVNVGVGISCTIYYYFVSMVSDDFFYLFYFRVHGLAGYLAAVSVAVKQAMPDHVLMKTPLGKFTNRNVPLTLLCLSALMSMAGLIRVAYCTMFWTGLVVSWIYLRFYQLHANGSRGDLAEGFSFSSFFPNVVQPPVAALGNAIFSVLVRVRVCKRPVRRYDMSGGGPGSAGGSISISLPGVDNQDAERRRQIALKALSDRLNKAESASAEQMWPSLDGSEAAAPLLVVVDKSQPGPPPETSPKAAPLTFAAAATLPTMPSTAAAALAAGSAATVAAGQPLPEGGHPDSVGTDEGSSDDAVLVDINEK